MSRKSIYPLLVLIVGALFYFLNKKVDQKVAQEKFEEKSSPATRTNNYFLPTSTTGVVVHHDYYSLSYREDHEQAEWVAYELKKADLSRSNYKRPYFVQDESIPTESADWRNYKNSGYDRGHLCPAGDRSFSKDAFDETFLTSNISPQLHEFNSGVWNRLEKKTRYWANKYDGVFVVTGGILNSKKESIGKEEVTVPEYFYKVLYDNAKGKPKMIGFLIPHKETQEPLYNFVVPVDAIEKLTGIDFFPNVSDSVEAKLEASTEYKDWSFR